MRYLAICAIFKNEARYLREWIRFHIGVGVEHFYLYNNNSTDDFRSALEPWIAAGRVTFTDWPEHPGQLKAYVHCIQGHRRDDRWMAFLDLDEFLFSPAAVQLPEILAEFEAYPAVGANWAMFGSGGHVRRPPGLVTTNYLKRAGFEFRVEHDAFLHAGCDPTVSADYRPYCAHIKTIANPAQIKRAFTPHSFGYKGETPAVDENFAPIVGSFFNSMTDEVSVRRLRVNHYWSRSLADLRAKLARGRATGLLKHDPTLALEFEKKLNEVEDRTILPLVQRIFARPPDFGEAR